MNRWEVLIKLINDNGYRKIAEIGVYRGKTVRKILEACELDRYLLVDPQWFPSIHKLVIQYPEVEYLVRTSQSAARSISNSIFSIFDLVFLDALHDYKNVLADIQLWRHKIRSGGILCGDDYQQAHCSGVKQAVDEVFGDKVELVEIGRKGVKIWVVRL